MFKEEILIFLSIILGANGILLNCTYITAGWTGLQNLYYCDAKVSLQSTNGTVSGVSGTHQSGRTDADVQGVSIFDVTDLTFVPQGITNFFPNLILIYFYNPGIKILNGNELDGYPHLEWFGLNNGNVESVAGNLFANVPNMKVVWFAGNNIKNIGWDLLNPVDPSGLIDFRVNHCINLNSQNNPAAFNEIVHTIRNNCTNFEGETTTLASTTFDYGECTTRYIEQNICDLVEHNKELENKLEIIENRLDNLIERNERLEDMIQQLINQSSRN